MHIFTQTLLAVYKEFPQASTAKICHHLGVPPQMVRESREYLHRRGYLVKDENLNYHITPKGEEELARIDRQLARREIEFIAGATETACKALGTTKEHLHSFALMDKGMTNDSYIFFCDDEKYIYRRAGRGSSRLVNREREYVNYELLKGLGLSDEVIYHDPKSGTKITKFIKNSRNIDENNQEDVEKSLETLRRLHNSGLKAPHDFDFLKNIHRYEELCKENDVVFYSDYRRLKEKVKNLLDKIDQMGIEKCFCHIDFVPGNCLVEESGKVLLIDWEYSGNQDRLCDVAMFCISADLSKINSDKLLTAYLQRKPTKEEFFRFYTYIASAALMWSLWSEYKVSEGRVFDGYTDRCISFVRKYTALAEKIL